MVQQTLKFYKVLKGLESSVTPTVSTVSEGSHQVSSHGDSWRHSLSSRTADTVKGVFESENLGAANELLIWITTKYCFILLSELGYFV